MKRLNASERLFALVTPAELRRLKLAALDQRVSVSKIVREALHNHFERRPTREERHQAEAQG